MREYFHPTLRRWLVQLPDGTWQYRYRHMMEQHLGRALATNEHVHHINGDQTDDRLDNLRVLSASEHHRLHAEDASARIRRDWQHDWSAAHAACVECDTTERKHAGHGLCERCYYRLRSRRERGGGARKPATVITRVCPQCGDEFSRTLHQGVSEHCSRSCASKTIAERAWKTKRERGTDRGWRKTKPIAAECERQNAIEREARKAVTG